MAKVTIALGSNLGDPLEQLAQAKEFLTSLSDISPVSSSIYQSEPIGPSEEDFFNAVITIDTVLQPNELFQALKQQEKKQGRPSRYPKWESRTIDLDIIAYDDLVLQTDTLIIPHKEYGQRLFVLLPLQEIHPGWSDPITGTPIEAIIKGAQTMRITKTELSW
ncbi:MAG: 2-amino-4-hydroxy-6-hydroxymethyldihydropteridine diphosphokinase [Balneola sp.]|nr:MAG: 2-amino-4-hydroxy-6-hydroxymethyldihydropteridine diphosphokinase [Balneola sp.]